MAHFKTSDGVRIYFEEHGKGEPLLLAYGIGGNADKWQPNIGPLSARHRLILWEPRGHAAGRRAPEDPAKVTFGHWVLDLLGLLDYLGLRAGGGGGPVAGGGIATRFALKHPERVKGLVGASAHPPPRASRSRSTTWSCARRASR